MTEFTGPLWQIGDLGQLESAPGGSITLPEPAVNDQGPSGFASGVSMLDVRYSFLKDLVDGYAGRVPAFLQNFEMVGVQQIPIAHSATNIAANQTLSSGTTMTLASTPAQGIALNIPLIPFTGVLNSLGTATSATTAPITLDFGFGWCGTTANGSAVTVTDTTLFNIGMPLCIAHVGNTTNGPLLTNVVSIASSTVIQVGPSPNVPAVTNAQTPIGTGNAWGPSEFASTGANSPYPVPIAAAPYVAFGPGLFLDPRQTLARALVITSAQSASNATITIAGWDLYWAPITDTVTVTSSTGGSTSAYTLKTFKAVNTITPNITDSHNWSIGTSDVFGMPIITDIPELAYIWWAGQASNSTTGFTVPDFTATASSITGDVRGKVQLNGVGNLANGLAGGSTTGTVSSGSLAITGSRLVIYNTLSTWDQLNARLGAPQWQMGRTQA